MSDSKDASLADLVLADILAMQSRIGKFPSRDQYLDESNGGKYAKSDIVKCFGSWTKMVVLSGMGYSAKGKRDKQELRGRYFEHLLKEIEIFRSRPVIYEPSKSLLVIGDMHAPYMHRDYPDFLQALYSKYNCDRVVCVGDEADFHAISFHDSDPELLSAGPELEAAIRQLEPLYKAFPRMDIAESNHGSLVFRKGKHHGLPRNVLKNYAEILQCPPEWRWHFQIKIPLSNGEHCRVHHSHGANVLAQSKKKGFSLIQGHHHNEAGVQWWGNDEGKEFFAAFTGCGIDDISYAFAYNKNTIERPRLGALIVLEGIAFWKPMLLDKHGRWNQIVT